MGRTRAGHSLVELIAVMMVLGVTLAGVTATMVLSQRSLREASRLEEAAVRAGVILDSLSADPGPASGSTTDGTLSFDWVVSPTAGEWARVTVWATDVGTGALVVELEGAWARPPPVVLP